MKYRIHYIAEYKLIGGGGINRGELGSMTCTRAYDEYELNEAIRFLNQYECYDCKNIYNPSGVVHQGRKDDAKDGETYHLADPKIWHMNLRGDWRAFQEREKRTGRKPKFSDWKHIEGDTYCVKAEFFNLKTREIEYLNGEYQALEAAFKSLKFKDSKTRLLSDWTLYSKHLVKQPLDK